MYRLRDEDERERETRRGIGLKLKRLKIPEVITTTINLREEEEHEPTTTTTSTTADASPQGHSASASSLVIHSHGGRAESSAKIWRFALPASVGELCSAPISLRRHHRRIWRPRSVDLLHLCFSSLAAIVLSMLVSGSNSRDRSRSAFARHSVPVVIHPRSS